jgi:hypothetical protein
MGVRLILKGGAKAWYRPGPIRLEPRAGRGRLAPHFEAPTCPTWAWRRRNANLSDMALATSEREALNAIRSADRYRFQKRVRSRDSGTRKMRVPAAYNSP